jgi:putative protease
MPIEEVNGETFIMASRDTCMIEHIPELCEAGIDSFKIEGRMKSAYYTAVVTNTYKMALDSYFSGSYEYSPLWYRELESVSHREYESGYYFKDSRRDANLAPNNGYIKDKAYLAVCTEGGVGRAKFSQRNKMTLTDEVELLTPGGVGKEIRLEKIYDEWGNEISSTPHPYMSFEIEADAEFKTGDIIRGK